jgi:hypothetical protein
MNTSKTLEEKRNEFLRTFWKLSGRGVGELERKQNESVDAFALEIYNSALDACRDSIIEIDTDYYAEREYMCISKDDSLSAIDSLRTLEGEE